MRKGLVVRGSLRRVASFVNKHGALETHYFYPILINAPSGDGHDTWRGPALAVAFGQDGGFRVERVPCEDWMGRFHLVPAEVGNDLRANSANAHAREERKCQGRIDQRFLPLGFGRIGSVEMELLNVQCQEREPGVIDIEDGSTWPVFEYVADFKIFVIEPGCFPVTLWAHLPKCRKCRFHNVSI